MSDWIYLDHHSRKRPSKGAVHLWGQEWEKHWQMGPYQKAVDAIGELLGADGHHLSLCADLFEAHQLVLLNHYIDFIRETGRSHILCAEGEQKTLIKGVKRLEEKFEVKGEFLPLNENGQLTKEILEKSLRPRTSLLSFSWAHPHTGVIQPASELIAICRENGVRVHVDASAVVGKIPLELADLDCDFLTINGALLGLSFEASMIFSKKKEWGMRSFPYPYYSAIHRALASSFDQIDHYSLEVGVLRDQFEKGLMRLGANLPFKKSERLPNVAVASFPDIHAEQLLFALKKEGVFASPSISPSSIAFALCEETKKEELTEVLEKLEVIVKELTPQLFIPFDEESALTKHMRVCTAVCQEPIAASPEGETEGSSEEESGKNSGKRNIRRRFLERKVSLSLLIDEEDGVIADVRVAVFGPLGLHAIAKIAPHLLMRKNTYQVRRITADLVEKEIDCLAAHADFNLFIDAIDSATEKALDIPVEEVYMAPPDMGGQERVEYPNWETLSDEKKKGVIAEVMERDIAPYVELDAGGVEVLKVEENRVTIAYSGNCTSCFSATGATLDAIGNILRHKIYPDLMVVPDLSLLDRSI